jgi:colanic acid/amylovoran biosynthesis glycosyltransferase
MRIAFLVDWFPNLSETFILNQITGLLERGHLVDIYASGPANQSTLHADVEKYNLLDHTFYHGAASRLMPKNKLFRFTKAIPLLLAHLPKKPGPLINSLNVSRFGSRAASLTLFYKTVAFLEKEAEKYDIVHCHFGPNGILAALLKDVGAIKGKVITTFHGYDISNYLGQKEQQVYAHLFAVGDMFLPISERWKQELIRLGCPEDRTVVHRMGVDINKFLFSPRRPRADGRVRLLTIARLVEKKGVRYGIEAVAHTLKDYPGLEYQIVGDGPLRNDLETLLRTLNVNSAIKLLGWKQQDEVVKLIAEADIFLAPSVTAQDGDQEGIPVVLMEALAQGVPVLSTQHSGIPELVQEGQAGFLVPERDSAALAEKLVYLLQQPHRWAEMGQKGREWVENYYDIHKLNDQLVALYQSILTNF